MGVDVSWLPGTTALGRRATLLGLGLLLAGFTTGNNLFHLIFAVLAAAELISYLAARHVLRRAHTVVAVAPRGRVGAPLRCRVEIENRSRWLPLPAMRWSLTTTRGERAEVVTPAVAPAGRAAGAGRLAPAARGRLLVAEAAARTSFPLGLVSTRCRAAGSRTHALIHPQPDRGDDVHSLQRAGGSRTDLRPRERGEDPHEAREYRAGDDARWIDWKATARRGVSICRERRGHPTVALDVHLDRSGAAGVRFETRVSRAAGTAIA
ncbi:MAG: DUF58 domain-containing protein, partial [Acidobacteriota bacterium]|nr:DUF58 domain-containing protein [Acidobacteriota bacterium]